MTEESRRRWGARVAADPLGVAVGALAALAYFAAAWARHRNYWSGAFDLGIFDQGVWQLSHGRDAVSLIERRVLADHFSPALLAFAPLYRLVSTPAWLLGGQAIALGATVLPMRALARHWGLSVWIPVALVLGSAPLLSAALFDMHPSTLAVPFVAWLVVAVVRDEPRSALMAAIAIGLCRADLALVVLAVAVVAAPRLRRRLGVLALVLALVGTAGPVAFGATNGWAPHFGHLGDGPLDAALHPLRIVDAFVSGSVLRTVTLWVLAAGTVVLLRPRWLAAVVIAGLPVLLSRWGGASEPWFHYGAPMVPIAIAGTLDALHRFEDRARWRTTLASLTVVGPVMCLLVASPLSPRAPDSARLASVLRVWEGGDPAVALAQVGPDEVVSASDRLVPHLAHRERVYLYPIPFARTRNYFAPGSEPDLSRYPRDLVEVVVVPAWMWDQAPRSGFRVTHRVDGYVVARPDPE